MLSNFLFSKPKNDRPSTECRPITGRYIGQVSTNYRPTIGEVSAKSRRSVGERKAISAETHPERLSTVCRSTIDRLSTAFDRYIDRVSTECRPSIDRVSTECRPTIDRLSTECRPLYRPLYRPISRSTLPTVNKIPIFLTVYEYWMRACNLYCEILLSVHGIKGRFTRTQICWQDFAK